MIELDFKCVPCGGYLCDCPEGIAKYEAKEVQRYISKQKEEMEQEVSYGPLW